MLTTTGVESAPEMHVCISLLSFFRKSLHSASEGDTNNLLSLCSKLNSIPCDSCLAVRGKRLTLCSNLKRELKRTYRRDTADSQVGEKGGALLRSVFITTFINIALESLYFARHLPQVPVADLQTYILNLVSLATDVLRIYLQLSTVSDYGGAKTQVPSRILEELSRQMRLMMMLMICQV